MFVYELFRIKYTIEFVESYAPPLFLIFLTNLRKEPNHPLNLLKRLDANSFIL